MYDYLLVGAVYTEKIDGINLHKYGAHVFHTFEALHPDLRIKSISNYIGYRHIMLSL